MTLLRRHADLSRLAAAQEKNVEAVRDTLKDAEYELGRTREAMADIWAGVEAIRAAESTAANPGHGC